MNSIIIRADASPQIGTGHIMRCLALAQALHDRGDQVIFAIASTLPRIVEDLEFEKMRVVKISAECGTAGDAQQLIRIATNVDAKWIITDGYCFGTAYQKKIKDSGFSLLVIDDYGHAGNYIADIVLNQNIYANLTHYPLHEVNTKFLLGSEYVLLRRQFRDRRPRGREIPPLAKKILVTLGGGDPENITLKVLLALKQVIREGSEVIVVCGGVNPNYLSLQEWVQCEPAFSLILDAKNMPDLMAWADLAIAAGGSTCWELMFMGLPFLSVIMSDNQAPIVTRLHELGATISLGFYKDLEQVSLKTTISDLIESDEQRMALHKNQASIIDGHGCQKVISLLT